MKCPSVLPMSDRYVVEMKGQVTLSDMGMDTSFLSKIMEVFYNLGFVLFTLFLLIIKSDRSYSYGHTIPD